MASTKIDIIANNKASAALGKVDRQLSGLNKSTAGINTGFNRMRNLILGVGAALGGIKIAKGFLDAAVEVENLGVQLKFITGSASEGAKALDIVTEAAANSSFQLRDMAQASPLLLTVADSTDELNTLLGITGDIAAASGLSFVETAGQLQRAMSGGIAAADLFRERGVKSLLGFQEGVRFTAEETKNQIMSAFENGTTTIAGASADMANTFTGQISMISDKVFQFQTQVMDAAPFEFLKSVVRLVNTDIEANFGSVEAAAQKFGLAVVDAATNVMLGGAKVIDALIPVFNTVKSGVNGILAVTDALPPTIKALGIVGFLMLGVKGKLIVLAIGLIIDKIKEIFNGVMNTVVATARKIGSFADAVGLDSMAAKINGWADGIENKIDSLGSSLEDFVHKIDDNAMDTVIPRIEEYFGLPDAEEFGPYETKLKEFLDRIKKDIDEQRLLIQEAARNGSIPFADGSGIKQPTPTNKPITKEEQQAQQLADALAKRVQQLRESLDTEREAENRAYQSSLRDLQDFYGSRMAFDKNYIDTRERLEKKHQEKIRALQKQEFDKQFTAFQNYQFKDMDLSKLTQEQKVKFVTQSGREVLRQMADHNRTAFKLNKAFAIGEAIINTAHGITKALTLGPILGPIMAGIVGAMGAVQIAAISSQQYQGRRFGGPVSNDESYIVGENGPELFTPGATGRITSNEGMISSKPVEVNFNITATDAASVDELIVQRRGMITNMVRQAIQERGNQPNF
jgi:hypothetical protein